MSAVTSNKRQRTSPPTNHHEPWFGSWVVYMLEGTDLLSAIEVCRAWHNVVTRTPKAAWMRCFRLGCLRFAAIMCSECVSRWCNYHGHFDWSDWPRLRCPNRAPEPSHSPVSPSYGPAAEPECTPEDDQTPDSPQVRTRALVQPAASSDSGSDSGSDSDEWYATADFARRMGKALGVHCFD